MTRIGPDKRFASALLLSAALILAPLTAQSQPADAFHLSGIERVVAIADIHGAYDPFVSLLQGTALVDDALRWSGGQTHLVIVGDVLDRGERSREALDLLMRLEQEAAAAGGAVHMLLGNHEIMNLSGELGYVTREEFSSYADLEQNSMRRPAQDRFAKKVPGLTALSLRSAFGREYPRGFFGHRAAFTPDGIYGEWLLNKPVLLVINDTAFVHAGLASRLIDPSVAMLNATVSTALNNYVDAMQVLQEADVLFPETDFNNHVSLVRRYLDNGRRRDDPAIRDAAEIILSTAESDPFGSDSPVWYRGMVECSPALEQRRLQRVRDILNVERLVIGHSPTRDHHVQQRFDNALLMADTGMLKDYYGGQPAALILENGNLSVYYADNDVLEQAVPMPRLVGARPFNVDDDALAALLTSAAVTAATDLPDGTRQLSLATDAGSFSAIFRPADGAAEDVFIPEVAAYRLDRLLGMDLIPVAVRRDIEGQTGAVFLAQEAGAGQLAQSPIESPWCPAQDQQALMQVFDYLINKQDRAATEIYYMSSTGKLVLGHGNNIFIPGVPAALPDAYALEQLASPETGVDALTSGQLEAALGDVLDAPRREALLARAARLLDSAGR